MQLNRVAPECSVVSYNILRINLPEQDVRCHPAAKTTVPKGPTETRTARNQRKSGKVLLHGILGGHHQF